MRFSQKTRSVVATTSASFLTPFVGSSVVVALPVIAWELSMNAISLTWVATGFLLSASVFLIPFGRLADLYGRHRVFMAGIVAFTVACALTAWAPSGSVLIGMRAFHGFASAMIFSTAMAIASASVRESKRGRALGINVAAVYLGLSLGPPVGGLLTQELGWRSLFLVTAFLGAGTLFLAKGTRVDEPPSQRRPKVDWLGWALYGCSLVGAMSGLSWLPGWKGILLFSAGLVLGGIFLKWENRTRDPILELGLFRQNRVFALSNLAALIHYSATFSVGFLLSLYLQFQKGMSPKDAGYILLIQPAVMAVLSPLAGALSDRLEPRWVASWGMAITVLGLLGLSRAEGQTPLSQIVACLVTLGGGYSLFSSPNANAVMGSVEKSYYGLASATLGTMRLLGHMLSMAVLTFVLAMVMGRVAIASETMPMFLESMRVSLLAFAVLGVLGTVASMVRGASRSGAQQRC